MLDGLYNEERKLDQIMTEGFRRIDEAVEGVIDRIAPPVLTGELEFEFTDSAIHVTSKKDIYDFSFGRIAENERVLMAQQAMRQGSGLFGLGDQHANGSPLSQLSADYRNVFGYI